MYAHYRKINDGSLNSSKYHKKDSVSTESRRAILNRDAKKQIDEETT